MPAGRGDPNPSREGQRYALPSAMAQVVIQLELRIPAPLGPLPGRLWDISPKGACIALRGGHLLAIPSSGRLRLLDPTGEESHHLDVDLRWATPLSHTTFVGVLITGGPDPREIFLADFMRRTWADEVPRSRFSL